VIDTDLTELAEDLIGALRMHGVMLATAESCTGGLIAGLITSVPGASDVFDRGFVTYSNAAKIENLGVAVELIERHGAVSELVARAMAAGALASSDADIAVAVTGIAGPAGGSEEKPVGLVHMAVARLDGPTLHAEWRYGDLGRDVVRRAAVRDAVRLALEALSPPLLEEPTYDETPIL
jgi:nicotinamide-nucleotide amidase